MTTSEKRPFEEIRNLLDNITENNRVMTKDIELFGQGKMPYDEYIKRYNLRHDDNELMIKRIGELEKQGICTAPLVDAFTGKRVGIVCYIKKLPDVLPDENLMPEEIKKD